MITDIIDPFIFIISLCVGLVYTYFVVPIPEIIIKYPTPFNAGKINYVDESGTCFKYAIEKVTCPMNKDNIQNIKLQ